MDARPFRPSRPLPGLGNENRVPPPSKTIHQRHKSTGNLLSMHPPGGLNGAAKRNALADVNRISKTTTAHDGSTTTAKNNGGSTMTIIKEQGKVQENPKPVRPKEAFTRPAQRPPSKLPSMVPSAPTNQVQPASKPLGAAKPKRTSTIVYNDSQARKKVDVNKMPYEEAVAYKGECWKNSGRESAVEDHRPITKDEQWADLAREHVYVEDHDDEEYYAALAHEVDHDLRQPRHHQSQPALRHEVALTRQKTHGNAQSALIDTIRSKKVSGADDEATEAPYMDAVEEQYSVQAPIEGPLIPVPSLPDPPIAPRETTKTEAQIIDRQPGFPALAGGDDQPELSDYEDEDYYDDQGYTTAHSYRSRGDNTTGGATTIMFPPKLTKKGQTEIEAAREIVESKRTEDEIQEDAWDVSMVAEYGDEIFQYMKELEISLLPNAHYMDIQTEIQWSMRSVLMDWVVQVHTRFGLLPETLFLTVNYIDRFLSYKIVSLGKLQLVGATAIFVAAKYEEINCPSVQEIVYMVDGGYSVDEILKAERFMLSMLNFELGWPGPMSFLRRISKADDYDLETRTVAKYFLEVAVMDERFVASPPSYIAAGSHCLSRLMLGKGEWTPSHVHYSGYTYNQLKPLVGMMLDCCRIARKHHNAVFEKYADKRYKRAASYVEGQLAKGFTLPFQQSLRYHASVDQLEHDTVQVPYAATQPLKMPIPTQG